MLCKNNFWSWEVAETGNLIFDQELYVSELILLETSVLAHNFKIT